ncbi:protein-serine/threonine phosphatase [Theileria orientalis]|uniref:Serine/threonine-protein phosphatase n=1 Tax=Theileria orientalis TaxID=68886 RepID=A0A976M3M6_THEOR|nr:protein-serine/threonine phosphatase [Theileria orientalis]
MAEMCEFGLDEPVMVYGIKGFVKYIGKKEYIKKPTGNVVFQLMGVDLVKRLPQCTNGSFNGAMLFNSKNGTAFFVNSSSLRRFDEKEAAAIRIQATLRMFLAKIKYKKDMSFIFWNHMENLHEFRILESKKNISLPIIEHLRKLYSDTESPLLKSGVLHKRRFSDQTFEFETRDYPPSDFNGPKLGKVVTSKFAHELLDGYKSGSCIELPIDYAQKIMLDTLTWYKNNDRGMINHVSIPPHQNSNLIIVGDLHGQLNDLLWIFYKFGPPSTRNVYLFNGDIADRGNYATNIFLLLFAFKLAEPSSVIINRGNHESDDMNESYGFTREVLTKYDGHIYNLFQKIFWELPLVVIIENRIVVVHGGLFRHKNVTLEKLSSVDRKRTCPATPDNYEDSLMFDLLWSDPQHTNGIDPSSRGAGCIRFGPDVTTNFLKTNNLEICIRSHQVPDTLRGIDILHNGKCVTLFSASNYCQTTHNTGAILIFTHGLKFEAHEYISPSLESIQSLENSTNNVTQRVIEATLFGKMEIDEKHKNRKPILDRCSHDVLMKICELVCEHKQKLWLNCYKHDKNRNGTITPEAWRNGLNELAGTIIPSLFSITSLNALNEETGLVHYNDVLKHITVGFEPVGYDHQHLKRECIAHIFDTMLKSDLSLREILMLFDRNLDGLVSYSELDEAIRKLNIGLSNPQVKILMRTIFSSCLDGTTDGKADIVEFLSKLKVIYSESIKYHPTEEWMEKALPSIGKLILSNRVEAAARYYNPNNKTDNLEKEKNEINRRRSSAIRAFALFQKFQEYDKAGEGLLSYDDFVKALKTLDLSKVEDEIGVKLTDHHLKELARMIDVTKAEKINYLEFLQAFYVVDESKYSVVNEMWDHICATMYKHKNSLKKALSHYDTEHIGKVYVHEFKDVLYALYDILGKAEAPLTFEQTEVLVECIDTNHEGMILYDEFLESFRPMYTLTK